jgi:nucleotide-binding universal stress UspA family protein
MHLLIALDNSPLNERITEFLKEFLPAFKAAPRLSFIHVIDNRYMGAVMGYPDIVMSYDLSSRSAETDVALISQIRKEGRRMIKDIEKQLGIPGTIDFPLGDPVSAIAEACRKKKPDLLVMGSHGRKGINHFLFGNFSEKILRHVNVPHIIIPDSLKHLAILSETKKEGYADHVK